MIYQRNEEICTKSNNFFNQAISEHTTGNQYGNHGIDKRDIQEFANLLGKYNDLIAADLKECASEYKEYASYIANSTNRTCDCVFLANDLLVVFYSNKLGSSVIEITTRTGQIYTFNTLYDDYREDSVLARSSNFKLCHLSDIYKEMMLFCGCTIDNIIKSIETFECSCSCDEHANAMITSIYDCKYWKQMHE